MLATVEVEPRVKPVRDSLEHYAEDSQVRPEFLIHLRSRVVDLEKTHPGLVSIRGHREEGDGTGPLLPSSTLSREGSDVP